MTGHILSAWMFDGAGGATALEGDAISQAVKEDVLAWVHLDVNNPDTKNWLEREISYLDPLVIEALLAEETRPRVIEVDQGALIILRGVNLNEGADPEDMVSIRLWIDQNRIISLQKRDLKAVGDIESKLRAGKGPRDAGQFIAMLVARLFERMEPVLTDLDELTDTVEERVLENPDTALRENIVAIRKQAIIFRRYMAPQKEAIGHLRAADFPWLDVRHKRHLQENQDRVIRYIEDLDAIRERAQIVKDELTNMIADRLNRNMYMLSVIAAIFLPLGFLTGLMGINVGGIPGAENSAAFIYFCAFLSLVVLCQVVIFRKLKWL